jgi:hypothetical protein
LTNIPSKPRKIKKLPQIEDTMRHENKSSVGYLSGLMQREKRGISGKTMKFT